MATSRSDVGVQDGGGDSGDDVLTRGMTVGRYVVLERLGVGAMGVVYAAYDPDLDRKIALKLLRFERAGRDTDTHRARLVREAKAIAKLSHPNVVGIFDVGVYEGQVFLAMEHLSGGTLGQWLQANKRSWPEVLEMFRATGRGLSAAHAEGLVHRDFKPDNVLVDRQGTPKIVDFGLVRLSLDSDEPASAASAPEPTARLPSSPSVPVVAKDLTRTGALTGTPAYMAPEQFLGQAVSAASDQFAYCVALYQALYAAPPFSGTTLISLAAAVVDRKLNPPPAGTKVPAWVHRVLDRGLALEPASRFATMSDLVRELDRQPVTLKRIGVVGGIALAAASVLVAVTSVVGGRMRARAALESTIARSREEARLHDDDAKAQRAAAERWRAEAMRFFDEGSGLTPGGAKPTSWSQGESDWARALETQAVAQSEYAQASTAVETTLLVDPQRADVRLHLLEIIGSRLTLAETFCRRDLANELRERLKGLTAAVGGHSAAAKDEAKLTFPSRPRDVRITIAEYVPEPKTGRLRLDSPRVLEGDQARVASGSYLLTFTRDGKHIIRLPVLLARGREMPIVLQQPRWSAVPDGFVFVHPGESLLGSDAEDVRVALDVPPLHPVAIGSFLIGRFEVTFAEYIRWLETLPARERTARLPKNRSMPGAIELQYSATRGWTLILEPSTGHRHVAAWGEPIRYTARVDHKVHDWGRFPVTGISFDDAQAYTRWLDRTGTVPGAHVCREEEWERAARGADGRIFANGWRLLPSEANMELTYGHRDDTLGPDEVGSHPGSATPFAAEDLEGNAAEMVAAARWGEGSAQRGGSWYNERVIQRADNRFKNAPSVRSLMIGFRTCAPAVID